jgi:hypothetical protein
MAVKEIRFSQNWNNKLNGEYFTTIRRYNPEKYAVGEVYHITMKTKTRWFTDFGNAVAVDVKKIMGRDFNEFICGLDTGYSVKDTKVIFRRMYGDIDVDNTAFSFMLLRYT